MRRAREAGAGVTAAGAQPRPAGARGCGAARARHRRDGLERLPVDPLERGAVEGRGARERAADRLGQGGGPREHADARSTSRPSPSGSTPTPRRQTQLTDFYFDRFRAEFRPAVNAWVATKPLKNPNAPLDALRDAPVQARGARARPSGSTRRQRSTPPRCGGTSSARRTTCSASSSSPRRCSSQASAPSSTSPRIRVAMLALGCAVFLFTALWIATSPVSVTV